MKKLLLLITMILLVLSMTACTQFNGCNKDILDLTMKYNYAYINTNGTWTKYEISSWTDYEGEQLQIVFKDGNVVLVSSVNCILTTKEMIISR